MLGQALLAKHMGKQRLVAETGAGQHGVASATAAALLGLECKVYMGAVDVERQALNVFRMKLLGAEVEAVHSGSRTLKDAVNEAMRDWVATVETTHYCLGSVMGPHPYPWMVREFHRVIGDEAREQCECSSVARPRCRRGVCRRRLERHGDLLRASSTAGAGSDRGRAGRRRRGRSWRPGVVHGMKSYLMQDEYGQVLEAHSISAGLDYPGVGPEHSYLASIGRADLRAGRRRRGHRGLPDCCRGPKASSRRSSRPMPSPGWFARRRRSPGKTVLVNLSGRGDKDVGQMMEILNP